MRTIEISSDEPFFVLRIPGRIRTSAGWEPSIDHPKRCWVQHWAEAVATIRVDSAALVKEASQAIGTRTGKTVRMLGALIMRIEEVKP